MKMKAIAHILICCCVLLPGPLSMAEDYQYHYFKKEKEKHTPFSDYIPRVREHYETWPHYLEDYYELYGMKQHFNENSLRMNILRLKTALECNFRHPSRALVKVESEKEYLKYRLLMFMHINILIMRNYLQIGVRYDKRYIHFYNLDFAREISESLDIAERYYREALPYWEKARQYADRASAIKITTDLGFMESERYSIIKGEVNYGKTIDGYLSQLRSKKQKLSKAISDQKEQ